MKKKSKKTKKTGNTWGDIVVKIYTVAVYIAIGFLLVACFYSVNGPYHFETVIVQEIKRRRIGDNKPGIFGISLETGQRMFVQTDDYAKCRLGDTVVARYYDRFPNPCELEIILPYREQAD